MVRSRKKGYIRRGDYIEVRVKLDASYRDVAEASVQQLQSIDTSSSEDDDWSREAVLVRANETVVMNRPIQTTTPPSTMPWDIGSYMRTFNSFVKTGLPVKLGVGFIDDVRYSKLTSNILNTHHSVFIKQQQDSGPARKRHHQERLPNAGMEVLYVFRIYTCTIRQSFRQVLIVVYSGRPCDLIYSTARAYDTRGG